MKLLYILTTLSIGLYTHVARAQFADSMQIIAGSTATVATRDYQPLWLVSNRFGTISDRQADLSTYISVTNKHVYKGKSPLYDYLRKYEKLPAIALAYGIKLYLHQHFQRVFMQQGYVKISYNHWQLSAGRYEQTIGEVDPELSGGSLGVSRNAVPVPKISLAVTEYTAVPFTNGWLQFKGLLSHGWMVEERYVKNALLHERNLYLRIGNPRFRVFGGLNRFAVWGGKHPDYGQLSNTWNDYKIIAFGRPVDDARPYAEEKSDRRGNHLGFIDYGFNLHVMDIDLSVYRQVPFEDRSGLKPLANPDNLWGVSLTNRNPNALLLSSLTLEYLDTRFQGGNGGVGRDNYYNNRLYAAGWSYLGRVLGTPLFTDRDRAARYFDEKVVGADRWYVVNNRIKGLHLGWKGYLLPELHFRTLVTYTENYGNYFNKDQFAPFRKQWYFMQEVVYQTNVWKFTAALGVDAGELTHNAGLLLGVAYDLKHGFPTKLNPLK